MLRVIFGLLLMLIAVAGCSGDTPTAVVAQGDGGVVEAGLEMSAVGEVDLQAVGLDATGRPGMNIHKYENPRGGSMTRRTWKAARQLERAAHEYARDNEGIFPGPFHLTEALGKSFVDYLPGGLMLRNAFTELRTEPSGLNASSPGAIGYSTLTAGAINVGFVITAMGADPSEEFVIVFEPD